jgi:glutamyl-tRNA(Gln) amidotransferase subunit E
VKRGLGSIRQDLNISIPNGALIEIKGVQELQLLEKAVKLEIERQTILLQIKEELLRRGVKKDTVRQDFVELNDVFQNTKARVLKDAISKQSVVLGTKLSRFSGLLGRELGVAGLRFGTELAGRAIFMGGVGGIFHSDELPGYGIVDSEISEVKQKLNVGEGDAFVLVADDFARATQALDAVVERAVQALSGVPEETRNAMPDGSSRFSRPRPGAARMYPETDVPSTSISRQWIEDLRSRLPETQEQLMRRLSEKFSLNQKLAKQIVDSDYLNLFEQISTNTKKTPTSFIATMLTETFKSLERDGVPIHMIDNTKIKCIFELVENGTIAREAMPDLLKWQSKNLNADPKDGMRALGIRMLNDSELESIIDRHIKRNQDLITERGSAAFASLMGSVMSEVRGSADPKVISQKLKERLPRKP